MSGRAEIRVLALPASIQMQEYTVKLSIEIVINHTIGLKPQQQNERFNDNIVSLTDTPTGPKPAIVKWGGKNRGYLFNI